MSIGKRIVEFTSKYDVYIVTFIYLTVSLILIVAENWPNTRIIYRMLLQLGWPLVCIWLYWLIRRYHAR